MTESPHATTMAARCPDPRDRCGRFGTRGLPVLDVNGQMIADWCDRDPYPCPRPCSSTNSPN